MDDILISAVTAVSIAIKPRADTGDAVAKLKCIAVVDNWMAASPLNMNSEKSEVILVGCTHMAEYRQRSW